MTLLRKQTANERNIDQAIKSLFAKVRGEVHSPDPKTVRLRLPAGYFEPATLVTFLRKTLMEKSK